MQTAKSDPINHESWPDGSRGKSHRSASPVTMATPACNDEEILKSFRARAFDDSRLPDELISSPAAASLICPPSAIQLINGTGASPASVRLIFSERYGHRHSQGSFNCVPLRARSRRACPERSRRDVILLEVPKPQLALINNPVGKTPLQKPYFITEKIICGSDSKLCQNISAFFCAVCTRKIR